MKHQLVGRGGRSGGAYALVKQELLFFVRDLITILTQKKTKVASIIILNNI